MLVTPIYLCPATIETKLCRIRPAPIQLTAWMDRRPGWKEVANVQAEYRTKGGTFARKTLLAPEPMYQNRFTRQTRQMTDGQ